MLHYKLQIGCMVIVLLVLVLYFRERHQQKNMERMMCFERLLIFFVGLLRFGHHNGVYGKSRGYGAGCVE